MKRAEQLNELPSGASEIRTLGAALSAGQASSIGLVDDCLGRINDPAGEGARTFIKVWHQEARLAAAAFDDSERAGEACSPVAGLPISVKDLFDVKDEVTLAGARARDDSPPAPCDAPVISRLRSAGAVLIGRTNMTQFAYSAVGLNPHFGTPGNPWDRARTPGGSSSGAAVSVADRMAVAAIGSDTVGSIRVPAAFCGVVGFKPTQRRVPRDGAIPLSMTLDTVGPLARSVEDCALVFGVIAGEEPAPTDGCDLSSLRLAIPKGKMLEGLDSEVAGAFTRACNMASRAGAKILEIDVPQLEAFLALNPNATIQAVEAMVWHRNLIGRRGAEYDPNVRARIEAGDRIAATAYVDCLMRRGPLTHELGRLTACFDAMIMPTVPIIAPSIEACMRDESSIRAQLIRNTSPFNYFDRPAISIPIQEPGSAPVGLMLVGGHDEDWKLLAVARAFETGSRG
ncbi:amidase [Bradyrhizobium sp. Gha]|uniref:amidase n=1 Tax=Bradyrhizobium sp. Gha TaxID=1855318 RepID=UPI0008F1F5A6|nr:amidase [Bradyrhizobium sp. Gha]SFK25684.1 aspartyl-tRNA(Asn)/glutamyl-tRNA(Gln) amidotransferase subunit A [Bradyrhizobium sp. Gha]